MNGKRLVLAGEDRLGQPITLRSLLLADMTAERLRRMVELLQAGFERWPPFDPGVPAADHLLWKMEAPGSDLAALWVEAEDRLVAAATVLPPRMVVGGREFSRARLVDWVVHPAWRGRGLSRVVDDLRNEVCPAPILRLTEAFHPAIRHISEAGVIELTNPVKALLRQVSPARYDRPAGSRAGPDVAGGRPAPSTAALRALGAWNRLRYGSRRRSSSAVSSSGHFDHRFERLWERVREDFDVIQVRIPEYLEWRYHDPRGGPSIVRAVEDADGIAGYAVLKIHGSEAWIADLLALPGRLDVVSALVADSLELLRDRGAARATCWLPERHPYRRELWGLGFVDARRTAPMRFRGCGIPEASEAILRRPDLRLHYTLGDSDFV